MLHHFSLPDGFLTLSAGLADSDACSHWIQSLEVDVVIMLKAFYFHLCFLHLLTSPIPVVPKKGNSSRILSSS